MSRYVTRLVQQAKKAAYVLNNVDTKTKKTVLLKMAAYVCERMPRILAANKKDVARAVRANKVKSFIDRLTLTPARIEQMAQSLREIAEFHDPVGEIIKQWRGAAGIAIQKVRAPIGVVLVVYEARPNVTSDCIGLLFKSNNIAILRGGKDAVYSNTALVRVLTHACRDSGIPGKLFFMVENTEHAVVDELLRQHEYIDLVIPRGGQELIKAVVEKSRIPVIKHYKGVCHIFVDQGADIQKALAICINSKVQRPGVCNAVEKILVHQKIAQKFLGKLQNEFSLQGVEMRGDARTRKILPNIHKAHKSDWTEEYLDLIVALKVVGSVGEAITHINQYGSHHTDAIVTNDKKNARRFCKEVDSACVFHNISTRFSDGGQFGLGAEIGISTDKLHARGPMGVEDLTTYKYVVAGDGQVRQ